MEYILSLFQKLCNHLNFRHKMAQYAARDSIDLHCQVMYLYYHVIIFKCRTGASGIAYGQPQSSEAEKEIIIMT